MIAAVFELLSDRRARRNVAHRYGYRSPLTFAIERLVLESEKDGERTGLHSPEQFRVQQVRSGI